MTTSSSNMQASGIPTVGLSTAVTITEKCIRSHLVPFIKGSPGVGKSAIIKQLATTFQLEIIDLRLSQCDPTDLQGFPVTSNGRSDFAPPAYIPLEGKDELPKDKAGWLLFLDEFNSADRSVQRAAYKLVLDRQIGVHNVHPNVAIVCAGNLDTDNAITEELSSALQSRLVHLTTHVDVEEWLAWARSSGIDNRISSFIAFKPDLLHKFNPDSIDTTFPCPRTWEFAHKYLKNTGQLQAHDRTALAGIIGKGASVELDAFLDVHTSLPTMQDILKNPTTLPIPEEPSVLFALSGAIGNFANDTNITTLVSFIERLPTEFTIITLREVIARTPALSSHKAVTDWMVSNVNLLG
jgi:hypothetical protein